MTLVHERIGTIIIPNESLFAVQSKRKKTCLDKGIQEPTFYVLIAYSFQLLSGIQADVQSVEQGWTPL